MILGQEQIESLAKQIDIVDILKYIEEHSSEYGKFLENERKEEELEKRRIKESKTMGKLELQN